MSVTRPPTPFGRSLPPDEAWLAKQPPEPILDPDLPIIDTHHHLWQRPQHRYVLEELLADLQSGHNVPAAAVVGTARRPLAPLYGDLYRAVRG